MWYLNMDENRDNTTTQWGKGYLLTFNFSYFHHTTVWCRCFDRITCLTGGSVLTKLHLGQAAWQRCAWAQNWLIKLKFQNMIWNTAIYMTMNYLCCRTASIKEMRWAKPRSLQGWLTSKPHNLPVCMCVWVCVYVHLCKFTVFACDWPTDYCKDSHNLKCMKLMIIGWKCVLCACLSKTYIMMKNTGMVSGLF